MLTERQKKIMIAIVESYTENESSEPVGSSTLSKLSGLDYSTATLRNEMATLEELGYLEKTHTSSGRVPTEKGYRLYVDELMNATPLVDEVEDQVSRLFMDSKLDKKQTAATILKTIVENKDFSYGAIILEKTAYNSRIKKLDFVHLKKFKGLFLMVTDQGLVLSREVNIPEGINITNISNVTTYLDEKLHDVLLNDFKNAKRFEFSDEGFFDYMSNALAVVEFCINNFQRLVDDKKTIIGQYNILKHHDFADLQLAQEYLETLKNESIYQIVEFDNGPIPVIGNLDNANITIKIGSEHSLKVMQHCSSITAYYQSRNGTGAITVFGPLRMKYRYVVALLNGIVQNMK